ncbi:hypothetical protein RHMOL_Rhmol11G0030000 [Rhododendron molle]|uniref:Uncharacterized protein n=1 Tax=Rhododendron molle TaxID=49168 RepID=A0ACC0LP60_RHOML|nr:hypothetical protein RHMOL_Rhmol11G0030000 [Rhododendron molle]
MKVSVFDMVMFNKVTGGYRVGPLPVDVLGTLGLVSSVDVYGHDSPGFRSLNQPYQAWILGTSSTGSTPQYDSRHSHKRHYTHEITTSSSKLTISIIVAPNPPTWQHHVLIASIALRSPQQPRAYYLSHSEALQPSPEPVVPAALRLLSTAPCLLLQAISNASAAPRALYRQQLYACYLSGPVPKSLNGPPSEIVQRLLIRYLIRSTAVHPLLSGSKPIISIGSTPINSAAPSMLLNSSRLAINSNHNYPSGSKSATQRPYVRCFIKSVTRPLYVRYLINSVAPSSPLSSKLSSSELITTKQLSDSTPMLTSAAQRPHPTISTALP